jgi:hypothetical protein
MDRLSARKPALDFLIDPTAIAIVGSIALHALFVANLPWLFRPEKPGDKQPGTVKIVQLTPAEADRLPQTEPTPQPSPVATPAIVPPVYQPSTPTPPAQSIPINPSPPTTVPSFGGNIPIPPPFKPTTPSSQPAPKSAQPQSPVKSTKPKTNTRPSPTSATATSANSPPKSTQPKPKVSNPKTPVSSDSDGLDTPIGAGERPEVTPKPIPIKPVTPPQAAPPKQNKPISPPANSDGDGLDTPTTAPDNDPPQTPTDRTSSPTQPAVKNPIGSPKTGSAGGGNTQAPKGKPGNYSGLVASKVNELQRKYGSVIVKTMPLVRPDANKTKTYCNDPQIGAAKTVTVFFVFRPFADGERVLEPQDLPIKNMISQSGGISEENNKRIVGFLLEKVKNQQEEDDRQNQSPGYLQQHVIYRYDVLLNCR